MRVGFVGAGRMGRPMVDRLVAAGHEVTVLGRSPEARQALAAAGTRPVAEAAAVAGKAEVACVCVFSDEQVREVCLAGGLAAALPHGSAASRGLSVVAGRGSVATSARMLAEFLGKDVKVVRQVAAELGASLGVLDPAIASLEELTREADAGR
jgi:pyrroline-5-carboxylate reductase